MNQIIAFVAVVTIFFVTDSQAAPERLLTEVDIKPGENATALVVLLHGYTLNGNSLMNVQGTLGRIGELKGADILRPNLPLDTFSMATSSQITAELILAIDQAWEKRARHGSPYKRIVMVGHSMGGLYARQVYAAACGEKAEAPFEQSLKDNLTSLQTASLEHARPWAGAVDRIVLLAGMNRGWSISHHMSISQAVWMKMGVAIGYILKWLYRRPPIIFTVRRGSPFITQLRLQWLAMRQYAKETKEKTIGTAVTVQLLGTIDDLVSPDDNIDLVSGKDFVYLEVPESGHRNVIDMDNTDAGQKRQKALIQAFNETPRDIDQVSSSESMLTDANKVTDVVFVIHGIRDEGYWTRKIAGRVQRAGKRHDSKRVIAAETSSYGYFPMLSFLRPGAREDKVEWLMDRYTEARAMYPKANFHFVGHSHGTYLLAKSLQDYPSVRFDQVVFAGSVVQREYEWHRFIPDRVKFVLNFVATADWVVAFFPNALQTIGIQDLGSAGHDGFEAANTQPRVIQPAKTYIVGGHSAALQEAMWDSIAEFTVTGKFQLPPDALRSEQQAWWVAYPAKVAPLIWLVVAGLLAWVLYLLLSLRMREWIKTVVIIGYLTVIWIVLTEV